MRSLLRSPLSLLPKRLLSTAPSSAQPCAATALADNTILQPNSNIVLPVTTTLNITDTNEAEKIPVFRMLDPSGKVLVDQVDPAMNEELAHKMYQHMIRIHYLDDIMYNAQRQGRISFYMQASGEEAIHIGKHIQVFKK
jgi:hypothetical protein